MENPPLCQVNLYALKGWVCGIYVGYCLALSQREWYFLSKALFRRKTVDLLKIFGGIILGGAVGLGLSYLTRGIGSA
jgi:hypothetical protein